MKPDVVISPEKTWSHWLDRRNRTALQHMHLKILNANHHKNNLQFTSWNNPIYNILWENLTHSYVKESTWSLPKNYYRFQVTFQRAVPKFVANLPITFPSSEIGRELRNKVRKFISMFELVNKRSYSIIITNSMKYKPSWQAHWTKNFPLNCKFQLELWTFVYNSSNIEMFLRTLLRSSRPIFELGNVIDKFATNLGTALWKVTWNRQ
jgi:hypothetical protein